MPGEWSRQANGQDSQEVHIGQKGVPQVHFDRKEDVDEFRLSIYLFECRTLMAPGFQADPRHLLDGLDLTSSCCLDCEPVSLRSAAVFMGGSQIDKMTIGVILDPCTVCILPPEQDGSTTLCGWGYWLQNIDYWLPARFNQNFYLVRIFLTLKKILTTQKMK